MDEQMNYAPTDNQASSETNNLPPKNDAPKEQGSTGPIIGSIIVIVIIILGGLYFLSQRSSNGSDTGPTGDEIRQEEDSVAVDLATQSSSDEMADIEADLNSTELDNLDEELGNIDLEFNF